ncbi:kinase domain protein (macronuclear) [Tetrahymena thermophila SB210]|uniref:Kinase domain protein n=1 Tax=Tetrahymena thermophila (strain SB210) TaxID=312017 RepID=Q22P79_TETTS|nr:kinase domain protein [Tetrahymena thermophila SB210]EAR87230.2 kinase domain protein [Tetrahymena thermophila SB210]|eukprot:XP_001007475.2 kinase domain protein [Tetrahymena thermophila SB210]
MDYIKAQNLQNCYNKIQLTHKETILQFLKTHNYEYEKEIINNRFSSVFLAKSYIDHNNVAIEILHNEQIYKLNHKKLDKCIQILENFIDEKYFLQFNQSILDLQYGIVAIVTQAYEKNLACILENNRLTMSQIYALTYQLLKGVLLLQEKGIVIKDIQPSNILFSSTKNQFLLTYHRFYKFVESSQKEYQKRNLNYLSPQVIDKIKPYSSSDDIYSVGVIILEALLQRKLQGMEYLKLKSQNLLSVLPELKSHESQEFITKILCRMIDPDSNKISQPIVLLQQLNKLKVDEKQLKFLNLKDIVQCKEEIKQELQQMEQAENQVQIQQQKLLQFQEQIKIEEQNLLNDYTRMVKSHYQSNQTEIDQNQAFKQAKQIEKQNIDKQYDENFISQVQDYKVKSNIQSLVQDQGLQTNLSAQNQQKQIEFIEINDDSDDLELNSIYLQNIKTEPEQIQSKNQLIQKQDYQFQNIVQSDQNNENLLKKNQKDLDNDNLAYLDINKQQQQTLNSFLFESLPQTQLNQKNQENDKQILQNNLIEEQPTSLLEIQNILSKKIQETNQSLSLEVQEQNENKLLQDSSKQIVFQLDQKPNTIEEQMDKIENNKEIKIDKITDIYKSENYEIVDFDFRKNRIYGQGAQFLGMALQRCQKMTYLHLNFYAEIKDEQQFYYNQQIDKIGDQEIIEITKALQKCTNLTSLKINLCNNNIGSKGAQILGEYLKESQNFLFLSLNLSYNYIKEGALYIAQAFTKCQNLVTLELNLRNTCIQQREFDKICNDIAKLTNINFLDLDISQNFKQNAMNLDELSLIFKNKNLITLSLLFDQNLIIQNDQQKFMKGVENCTNLVSFSLSFQSIFEGQYLNIQVQNYVSTLIQSLCLGIQKMVSLSSLSLDLSCNALQIDQINTISETLKKCQNITSLSLILRQNWVDVESLKYIGISLEQCQRIDNLELNLQENKLGQQGLEDFSLSLSKCTNLQKLRINFSQNNIGSMGAILIAQSIQKIQNLKHLSLNLNSSKIGSEGAKSIALKLQTCINLTKLELYLSKNNLTTSSVQLLSFCLKNCTNIIDLILDLSRNKLQNQVANSIGVIFSQCLNIKQADLHLEGNSFDKQGINDILSHFQNCKSLTYLYLSLNYNSQQITYFKLNKLSIDNQITKIDKQSFKQLLLQKCQKLKQLYII